MLSTRTKKTGNPSGSNCTISVRSTTILAVLIMLVYLATTIALRNELALRSAISDLILPVVNGLATISLFIASRNFAKGTRARFAWTMLFIAELSFTLGDIIWAVIEVWLHQRPFPSIADLFYIACYPFAIIGILSLPVRSFTSGERLKIFLDMGIVIIAASLGFWALIIGPAIALNKSDPITIIISLIHPVLDLLLIFALLELLFRWISADDWKPVSVFVFGMMVWIVADLIYVPQFIAGTYLSGGLSDIGSVATYLLIGLAGVIRANSGTSSERESTITYIQLKWATYLPYAGAAAAYIMLIWSHYYSHYLDFGQMALGVGTLMGFVLLRQILAFNENERLYRSAQAEITLRQKVDEALRASERKYREFADSLPQIVYELDARGNFIFANPSAYTSFGYTKQEFEEGLNVLQTLVPGDRERVIRNIHRLMKGEKIVGQEYMLVRKDGSSFPVVTYSSVVTHEGQAVGVRGVAVDISDIKRVQEEINKLNEELEKRVLERTSQLAAANDELKELDNRKAEFIILASHEMRTPLTVMNGYLELFIEGYMGELTGPQREKLQIILDQNNHLVGLVNTLIEIYNINNKELDIKIEPVNLQEVAESSIENVSNLINLKELSLSLMVEDGLSTVDGDKNRLSQVFYNLLTNAIKYTPEHGQIDINIKRKDGYVLTSISDIGMGMPKKYLEKIFDPFFLGEDGSLAVENGRRGLGLTIVKRLIEAHQGRIWVESELSRGSTFYFSLPWSKELFK